MSGGGTGYADGAVASRPSLLTSLERLGGGLLTGLLAATVLLWVVLVAGLSLVGVGLLLLPATLRLARATADQERHRLTAWGVAAPPPAEPPPTGLRESVLALRGPSQARRELLWVAGHGTVGLMVGMAGVLVPLVALRDATFPLWWRQLAPQDAGSALGAPVHTWTGAVTVGLFGISLAAVSVGLLPLLARVQSWPGRRLLAPSSEAALHERIAHLASTRAAVLASHTAELRRIERALHDGVQSGLVGVVIQVGAARQALARSGEGADEALERAQQSAERALGDLRGLVRGMLPPALAGGDLGGAVTGLAAGCAVPCTVGLVADAHSEQPGWGLPSATQATAYFSVAEALTNVSRHSGASHATVLLRREPDRLVAVVEDDGTGGADETRGTGLAGIRQRVLAHDGTLQVDSPAGGPTRVEVVLSCGS